MGLGRFKTALSVGLTWETMHGRTFYLISAICCFFFAVWCSDLCSGQVEVETWDCGLVGFYSCYAARCGRIKFVWGFRFIKFMFVDESMGGCGAVGPRLAELLVCIGKYSLVGEFVWA